MVAWPAKVRQLIGKKQNHIFKNPKNFMILLISIIHR